jgi:uncharacterized repeat protein (TIGR03803 family)
MENFRVSAFTRCCPELSWTGNGTWWKRLSTACLLCMATAIPSAGQTFTNLVNFNGSNGASPIYVRLVQGLDGSLYGTTQGVLGYSNGTVFKVTTTGALTTLYYFALPIGFRPNAGLVLGADGNFYGTTLETGHVDGTVFKITPQGVPTLLHGFQGSDGDYVQSALIQATDGNFYGTTAGGGQWGSGTVFSITPAGTLTTLYNFCSQYEGFVNCTDGVSPNGALVQATDGNFYGTTAGGGQWGSGTVFRITPTGVLATLHSFDPYTEGYDPAEALIQATDGNFYGTTEFGGDSTCTAEAGLPGCGTVFKIAPTGTLTTLHSFEIADGSLPQAGLVQATDGNFYGTTKHGGSSTACGGSVGCGTVFKITPSGTFTTVHNFDQTDGEAPFGGLVQATNGILYGTTASGGAYGYGSVFELQISQQLVLSPATSSPKTGDTETLTATAKSNDGTPLIGLNVTFTVTGANPASGTGVTDTTGQATFSYVGTNAGTDIVVATATINDNPVTSNQASVKWTSAQPPSITSISPASGTQGQSITSFTVTGINFQQGVALSFSGDAGIHVNSSTVTATQIIADISISIVAETGPRDVTIVDPDGQSATLRAAFTTLRAQPPAQPAITISPTALQFGSVPPHGSQTLPITITNSGTAPLVIYGADSFGSITSASSFAVSNPISGAINPDSSATITVTFSPFPRTVGTISATLGISSNAPTGDAYVTMTGVAATQEYPLLLLPMDEPLVSPPLDIEPINTSHVGNKIVSDFTIRNLTGTWYEVTLDPNDLYGPTHPKAPNWLSPPPTMQQVPTSFLIGPRQVLKFPQDGTHLTFSLGQYIEFRATKNSINASVIFALDMGVRGLFGTSLLPNPSTAILTQFVDLVDQGKTLCGVDAQQTMLDALANTSQGTLGWDTMASDNAGFISCVASNPVLVSDLKNLLQATVGSTAANQWVAVAKDLNAASLAYYFTNNFWAYMVPLGYAQLTSNSPGYVLLQVPFLGH